MRIPIVTAIFLTWSAMAASAADGWYLYVCPAFTAAKELGFFAGKDKNNTHGAGKWTLGQTRTEFPLKVDGLQAFVRVDNNDKRNYASEVCVKYNGNPVKRISQTKRSPEQHTLGAGDKDDGCKC